MVQRITTDPRCLLLAIEYVELLWFWVEPKNPNKSSWNIASSKNWKASFPTGFPSWIRVFRKGNRSGQIGVTNTWKKRLKVEDHRVLDLMWNMSNLWSFCLFSLMVIWGWSTILKITPIWLHRKMGVILGWPDDRWLELFLGPGFQSQMKVFIRIPEPKNVMVVTAGILGG